MEEMITVEMMFQPGIMSSAVFVENITINKDQLSTNQINGHFS